ncbi:hypothetical protein [Alteromonas facilis]|uniref:hypothetical protein n=1 Tax=Alteromonas facilis TaxID=2048004 RepID=UPI000C2938B6|nr:hypothetical protein [Alteromonas facilis]
MSSPFKKAGTIAVVLVGVCVVATLKYIVSASIEEASKGEELKTKMSENPRLAIERGLERAAVKINSDAPITVDEGVQLIGASVGSDLVLSYHYRLINYTSSQIDPKIIKTSIYANVKKEVCKNEQMITALRFGGEYIYEYEDKHGSRIAEFSIDKQACDTLVELIN